MPDTVPKNLVSLKSPITKEEIATLSLRTKLRMIQIELKAPKTQFNDFAKFNYRSAEDIQQAVKPLLDKYQCTLMTTDEVVHIGDRFYVKAKVMLWDDMGSMIATEAYAREDETKKGMDGSQITGSASSYAKKYALNGLFLLDDTKDSDAMAPEEKPSNKKVPVKTGSQPTPQQLQVRLGEYEVKVKKGPITEDLKEKVTALNEYIQKTELEALKERATALLDLIL